MSNYDENSIIKHFYKLFNDYNQLNWLSCKEIKLNLKMF